MIVGDQSEVIAFLSRPETFGVAAVEEKETHISHLFLAGDKAYKLKRAVLFPYLDFSTPARRRHFCEAEIAVNRRTAPQIYERVAAVTRADGRLAIDGEGTPIDYLVVMKRFDEAGLFDRLSEQGALTDERMTALADEIARLHAAAERRFDFGGLKAMVEVIAGNGEDLVRHAGSVFGEGAIGTVISRSQAAAARNGALLEARKRGGFVRRCHGDLHLRNICLYEGRPLLFDAIEFSDPLAFIDVLYDLAFLLMDLEHRGLRRLGNLVLNRYLAQSDDVQAQVSGLAALPLFLACRATVRAHVGADTALSLGVEADKARLLAESRRYLDLAAKLIEPPPPRLVAIGGLSGSGKSTLAREVAADIGPVPGALVLRSDTIRKRLYGAGEFARLPEAAYSVEMTRRVYGTILDLAEAALEAGHGVIADAVHARPEERAALESVAAKHGVPFTGLWLEAPRETMERRIRERLRDASDATIEVLRRQLALPLGEISWRRVDASGGFESTLAAVRRALAAA